MDTWEWYDCDFEERPEHTARPVPPTNEDQDPGSGSDLPKTLIRLEHEVTEVLMTGRQNLAHVLDQDLPG